MKAVIIGSGISGLTAAAALAQAGYEVTVMEQNSKPGGVTASYEQSGYRWDLGQLLIEGLGPDEPGGEILAKLGVLDKIQVRVDDRGYVFPDFELRKPQEYQGILWRINLLKGLFPGDVKGLDLYWQDNLCFTRAMTLARRMEKARGLEGLWVKARFYLALLPLLPKKDWNAQQLMDHFFHSDKLKAVFTSILADFFTPPSQFIGLGVFALNSEATFEKRMPRALAKDAEQLYHYSILGGIGKLIKALVARIEELGGRVLTNCTVSKILVENGRVAGVSDESGQRTPADVVVASGGVKETFLEMVGAEHLPADFVQKVGQVPLMDSVFMLHLGLDYDPSPYVHGVCTYYYGTYDVEGEVKRGKEGFYHEGQSGFVVHVPSLHTPEMAPTGCHAMTVYTICPDQLKEGNWEEEKERLADALIGYAEKYLPGLSQHILTRVILTPVEFRQITHTRHFAFGGISPVVGAWQAPHQTPVQGLWFVGQQSQSGGGVRAVLSAAYKTAMRIIGSTG